MVFVPQTWESVKLVSIIGGNGVPLFHYFYLVKINTLSLGEEVCIGLGQNPVKIRLYTLLLIIPMCARECGGCRKYCIYWAYRFRISFEKL